MKLSREKQDAARTFIFDQARPLERCLFAYRYEGGSPVDVSAELAKFRNPDGGFGRALEPDFRVPDSSVLATGQALSILRELRVGDDSSLVREAISYLLDNYDAEHHVWPIIPRHDNTAPHAPWWRYDAAKMMRWDEQRANPGCQIVSELYHYRSLVPPDFLEECTAAIVSHLDTLPDAMDMFNVGGYVALAETENLPDKIRSHIISKLQRAVACSIARDELEWEEHCLTPLRVTDSPDSPLLSSIWEEVQRNLDYEIKRQEADGSWAPNWSWGGAFPEVWPDAEKEWRGILTLKALKALRNFDRFE